MADGNVTPHRAARCVDHDHLPDADWTVCDQCEDTLCIDCSIQMAFDDGERGLVCETCFDAWQERVAT